jgi:hypothetical protein
MLRMRCTAVYLMAWACLSASLVWAGSAQGPQGRLVAHFARGSQPSQLGVAEAEGDAPYNEGPEGLVIGPQGDVYIGDMVSGKIKRFSKKGAVLAVTEGRVSAPFFCVGEDGSIFVSDTGDKLIVQTNSQGGRDFSQGGSRIRKFDGRGKLVWERYRAELLPREALAEAAKSLDMELTGDFDLVSPGPPGAVLVSMHGWRNSDHAPDGIGLLLDDKGALVRILPGFGAWSGGLWWSYESSMRDDQPPPVVTVKAIAPDGTVAKGIRLDTKADGGRHYRGVETGLARVLPDGNGGCYTICYARRAKPLRVSAKLSINSDYVINHYGPQGAFVQELRLPSTPFGGSVSSLAAGPDGSLYYLLTTASGFDLRVVEPHP